MCLFVHTEGSARHEHQLTGQQSGPTCATVSPLIYRYVLYVQEEKSEGPFSTKPAANGAFSFLTIVTAGLNLTLHQQLLLRSISEGPPR